MGAMSNLLIEAEHVFDSDNPWRELAAHDNWDQLIYAFSSGSWAFHGKLQHDNNWPSVSVGYQPRGESNADNSPVVCLECAIRLSSVLMLEEVGEYKFTTRRDPDTLTLEQEVITPSEAPLRFCGCGNILFNFVSVDEALAAVEENKISLGLLLDLFYLMGTHEHTISNGANSWIEPRIELESESV